MNSSIRTLLIACGTAAVLFSSPAESKAILPWLCPSWFGGSNNSGGLCGMFGARRTTYAPPYTPTRASYASSATTSSCVARTCTYVPQTCYRRVCERVPMTSYRPVTGCDPCTGCPTTYCCPQTRWVNRMRLVPYTTYRPVYGTACTPTYSTSACAPAVSYSGTSSCPSCVPSTVTTTPSTTPAPADSSAPSASSAPSLPRSGGATSGTGAGSATPRTFESRQRPVESPESTEPAEDEQKLQPMPEADSRARPVSPPQLIDPVGNRTQNDTPKPTRLFHTASHRSAAPAAQPDEPVDFGGWHAAGD